VFRYLTSPISEHPESDIDGFYLQYVPCHICQCQRRYVFPFLLITWLMVKVQYRHYSVFRYLTSPISEHPESDIDGFYLQYVPCHICQCQRRYVFLFLLITWLMDMDMDTGTHTDIQRFGYWYIGKKFNPVFGITSEFVRFNLISGIPITSSVWFRSSRISDWIPTYATGQMSLFMYTVEL
jgi:hypothetical protein